MKQFAPGLYRGPRPQSSVEVSRLYYEGIRTFINLQGSEDGYDVFGQIEKLGLRNYDIEQEALLPPSKFHVDLVMKALDNQDLHPIYLHCQAGVDRTGWMVAKYRLLQGMSKKSAIEEMKAEGMHWWFYWWAWFL